MWVLAAQPSPTLAVQPPRTAQGITHSSSHWAGPARSHPPRPVLPFAPASKTYTNVTANQTAQNYTARPTASPLGPWVMHTTTPYFAATVDQLATLNPALVMVNGDLEDNGFSSTEMNPLLAYLKTDNLYNKTFMIRGNHDDKIDGSAAGWESYFETSPNIPTRPAYVVNKVASQFFFGQSNLQLRLWKLHFYWTGCPGRYLLVDPGRSGLPGCPPDLCRRRRVDPRFYLLPRA